MGLSSPTVRGVMIDQLVLHASGLGWDEALVVFGGLAVLTAALLTRLQGDGEPAPETAQEETNNNKSTGRRKR
jgi:hypothetical protein